VLDMEKLTHVFVTVINHQVCGVASPARASSTRPDVVAARLLVAPVEGLCVTNESELKM
jgi:hypothetical protein